MVPGDIIEWTYCDANYLAFDYEYLWSSSMRQRVPIGSKSIHVLVSIDEEQMSWLNEKGLFTACMADFRRSREQQGQIWFMPRVRNIFSRQPENRYLRVEK